MGHEFGNRFRASCQALIPDPLGDPSPSSNRKLLVGADIFNGSGISPKEKLGKKYIYII